MALLLALIAVLAAASIAADEDTIIVMLACVAAAPLVTLGNKQQASAHLSLPKSVRTILIAAAALMFCYSTAVPRSLCELHSRIILQLCLSAISAASLATALPWAAFCILLSVFTVGRRTSLASDLHPPLLFNTVRIASSALLFLCLIKRKQQRPPQHPHTLYSLASHNPTIFCCNFLCCCYISWSPTSSSLLASVQQSYLLSDTALSNCSDRHLSFGAATILLSHTSLLDNLQQSHLLSDTALSSCSD